MKPESPLFSVIIPCWNAASTLDRTLQSLLEQTCEDWEALIIDDGSTDQTADIVQKYTQVDSRIRLIKTDRLGPSAARNTAGLNWARGTLLAFLDSDDLWTRTKLAESAQALWRRRDLAGVYGQISFFRASPDMPETHSTVYARDLVPADFLRDNPVCTMSNLVLRRSVFRANGGFDPTIVHNEDVEFLVRVSVNGGAIGGVNKHLVCYRTNLSGLSTNLTQMRAGWHKALKTLQASSAALRSDEIAAADAGNLRYLARRALRIDAPKFEALRLAAAGIRRSPKSFFSPAWRGAMTLVGAIVAPFLPKPIRNFAFCR